LSVVLSRTFAGGTRVLCTQLSSEYSLEYERSTPMTTAYHHASDAKDGDIWEDDTPPRLSYRVIYGVPRGVTGHELALQTSAIQYSDGGINTTDDPPQVSIYMHEASALTSDQARELAASLIEAADEVDGWVAR
jgi:hypothetical protein